MPCEHGCGAEVHFVLLREVDGKRQWTPPLVLEKRDVRSRRTTKPFVNAGYTVTQTYVVHECEAGVKAQAERRKAEQTRYAMVKENARRQDAAWVEALTRACPKCEAPAKARCVNLTKRRASITEATRWPHPDRLPEGWGT